MVESAHRRHWVEHYHEEAKGLRAGTRIRAGCGGASIGTR